MDKLQYAIICGFLIIRRLLDSHKVTDSTAKEVVNCSVYGLKKGRRVTYINWHKVASNFNLNGRSPYRLNLEKLANQFIHSYVFVFGDDQGDLLAYIASDWEKDKRVFSIKIEEIARIFEVIGEDKIHSLTITDVTGFPKFIVK